MVIGLVFLVMVIGLLMYMLCANAKVAELGRIMFAFSVLVLLMGGERIVGLLGGH